MKTKNKQESHGFQSCVEIDVYINMAYSRIVREERVAAENKWCLWVNEWFETVGPFFIQTPGVAVCQSIHNGHLGTDMIYLVPTEIHIIYYVWFLIYIGLNGIDCVLEPRILLSGMLDYRDL